MEKMKKNGSGNFGEDFMANFLETHVRTRYAVLRRAAVDSWVSLINEWVLDEASKTLSSDADRLGRLVKRSWEGALSALGPWDRRFSLQSVRTLPYGVIAQACQLGSADEGMLFSIVRSMTSAALAAPETSWKRKVEPACISITLSEEELAAIQDEAPTILGKCMGACNLLAHAQIWYRMAGKGKTGLVLPQLCTAAQLDGFDGSGLIVLPSIAFTPDELIDAGMQDYDRRRTRFWNAYARGGFAINAEKIPDGQSRAFCHAAFRMPGQESVPVHIPKLELTYHDLNRFLQVDSSWQSVVRFLGKYFPEQLSAKTNLTSAELEGCFAALGVLVGTQTLCRYFKPAMSSAKSTWVVDLDVDKEILSTRAEHLFSFLHRGYVRERRSNFHKYIAFYLSESGMQDNEKIAEHFIQAFSGVPDARTIPQAVLFMQVDDDTCVLELSFWNDFLEALMAHISEGDGEIGNVRGDLFEEDVRTYLTEALLLGAGDIPFPPNADVYKNGQNLGDVDFCFSLDNVLVNLDMKSWQRSASSFVGHPQVTNRRHDTILKNLQKVENRGAALFEQLNAAGQRFSQCVNLLVVATPEYLDPHDGQLWFGNPANFPKVVTPVELVELVRDKVRFQQLLISSP